MNNFRLTSLATLALLAALAAPHAAQAQTLIYDNGSFSAGISAINITSSSCADDFVFGSTQTFDSARVWISDNFGVATLLDGFSGTLSWEIYSNNAGTNKPNSPVLSGTVSGAGLSLTDTGVDAFGRRIFQADFSLGSQSLGAGTYWFRIKENGLSDSADASSVFWEPSGASTGFQAQGSGTVVNPATGSWFNTSSANRAFQLYAASGGTAPEPGSLALLALGGVVVLTKRRRK